ncbi:MULTISPECIES: ABC transporter substrate-binding protein [Bradyrhizobium]|jgi:peptide/nickel transport system substrate-binding protein|uniref:ABC transporter substrate-binding protein n=4 Tax=Bradyrhizobium TaxID=374 RepID=A0ABS5G2P8_9BRAD|nr:MULTISPECIES: ABC transporter substrate-binding protein [Bradyrhizobium]MBR1135590.1 ABC transporter substrate-binding protein [Bradyrhizobium denitrificans]MDU1494813.1 ABC transporter substrate-binding protein [Bradyrhizobium sp.]MDU1544934.1 ABC transporter substrate-binding protein [Bradyrhizobium sp.]MDU1808678.1 ABC transporter substrate-binding protein [Bradyrhizobium sp.]MDU2925707.1 ABC transporter substrate-binding protein [Bradyrhizobium sp.]
MSIEMSKRSLFAATALLAVTLAAPSAFAQSRAETLRYVTGATVNTLDPNIPGSTREAFALSMSSYDRLVSFGRKQLNGKWVFDLDTITGELAESYSVSADGLKITFKLRPDAKFQDGSPVTAEDVKWSLDRCVTAPILGKAQLLTGSLTSADQFKVIDPVTIEVTLPKPDKLALPNLATVYPIIINSKLAKAHATAEDPWALNWTKENAAGSGAYIVETFKPGEQVIAKRNEAWNRGTPDKPAAFKRLIIQSVPEPATRANLVERGDADLVIDLQASDVQSLEGKGKLKVISTPQYNAVTFISMNNTIPPFDNVNVRRAIAFALPYDDMFKAALFGRGAPLYGATWADGKPPSGGYPIPQPIKLDLEKAKAYLKEAGMPDGFSTTFSFNVGQAATAEPMAALVKEQLGKIGIKVDIQKLPDAQMSTAINEKKLPFFIEGIVAWLPSTDYFYRNFYTGKQRWNYSSTDNAELEKIAQEARFEADKAKYEEQGKALNAIHFDQMFQIPIWQAAQDAVMQPTVDGYVYQFTRQVDYRNLSRK